MTLTPQEAIQMYEDMFDTKRWKGEPIPQAWTDAHRRLKAGLEGKNVPASRLASQAVFGHPEATSLHVLKYGNLIPITLDAKFDFDARMTEVQELANKLGAKIGRATWEAKQKKGALAKKARQYLDSHQRVEDETIQELLLTQTLPELRRLQKLVRGH